MALVVRTPPGRAGRLWLRRRLSTAERGRDQLDRKLRILLPELESRRAAADRRRADWAAAGALARTWLLRAALLGGQDALRCAAAAGPARVEITWITRMGLRYPDDAGIGGPAQPATGGVVNAATAPALAAARGALVAGVRTAAAEEAVRRLEAEVEGTRRRLHALDERWLPSLRAALVDLELSLAQAEQEDGLRLRRARAE